MRLLPKVFDPFKVEGEYYFVMLDNAEVLLRSEGYPTTGARDNGPASVQKNRGIKERYSTVEDNDEYFGWLTKPGIIKKLPAVVRIEKVLLPCFIIFPF
jgi:uncharacterized protein YegP (UPF0339 family)